MESTNDNKVAESNQSYASALTSSTTTGTSTQTGVVTRDQQRRANALNDANDESDNKTHDAKKRDKDSFRGKVTEMH